MGGWGANTNQRGRNAPVETHKAIRLDRLGQHLEGGQRVWTLQNVRGEIDWPEQFCC
jgi:hypothetical protein